MTPDEYDADFARGAAMSYDEVVAYALGELDRLIAEAGTDIEGSTRL